MNFLDLFAGAGGLSEGFIREGFEPIAHIESDSAACYTLKTRTAYHYLKAKDNLGLYKKYISGQIDRNTFYSTLPDDIFNSVLNEKIGEETLPSMFDYIEGRLQGKPLDLVVGGPPCQAFSLVGRSKLNRRENGDDRNYLYTFYVKFLERFTPKAFVFENVVGLLSARTPAGERFLDRMIAAFQSIGYNVKYEIISANSVGVLQKRNRVILVGSKREIPQNILKLPEVHYPVVVNELFADLPSLQAGEGDLRPCAVKPYKGTYLYDVGIKNDNLPITFHQARPHNSRDLEIYRIAVQLWNKSKARLCYDNLPDTLKTHKNRTAFTDRFKVVAGEAEASHTVLAHAGKDGHYYIHPDITQNRSLTPREAARLQTFPDDYFFESETGKPARTTAFKQIGNAVPVVMAQSIAHNIKQGFFYEQYKQSTKKGKKKN